MSRLSNKNYKPRATGSLCHFILKVFCAVLKTVPFSLNCSTTPLFELWVGWLGGWSLSPSPLASDLSLTIYHRKHYWDPVGAKNSICMEIDLEQILIRGWKLETQSFFQFHNSQNKQHFYNHWNIKFSSNGELGGYHLKLKCFDGNSKLKAETVVELTQYHGSAVNHYYLFIFDQTLWYSWKVNVFMEVSSSILNPRSSSLASLHPVSNQPPSLEGPSFHSLGIPIVQRFHSTKDILDAF